MSQITFPKKLDEEKSRMTEGVEINIVVRERHSIRTYITGKQKTLWCHMILGSVLPSF